MSNGEMTHQGPGQESSKVFVDLGMGGQSQASGGPTFAPGKSPKSGNSSRFLSGGVIVAGIVVVVGIGAIYGMRVVSRFVDKVQALVKVEFDEAMREAEEAQLQEVMLELDRSARPVQLASDLGRDPFAPLGGFAADIPVQPADNGEDLSAAAQRLAMMRAEQERQRQEARNQRINDALEGIAVEGLIGGRVAVARINGKAVRVGEVVADMFTVESIDGRHVVLEADGRRFQFAIGKEAVELFDHNMSVRPGSTEE